MSRSRTSTSGSRLPTKVADRLRTWRAEPVTFAREVFGIEAWPRQAEILNACRDHKFVATRSGHKVSKSNSIAISALWTLVTDPGTLVVLSAPAAHQIENILWPEIRSMYFEAQRRGYPLGGHLYDDPRSGLWLDDKWQLLGLTTDKPERIAGISGAKLRFYIDEASGYPEPLFSALEGNLAAAASRMFLFGNPTQTSGKFFDAFHTKQGNWKTLHISSLETPNFHGGNVPGLASPEWYERMRVEWGVGPILDVRAHGEFPREGEDVVIGLALLTAAIAAFGAPPDEDDDLPLGVGVDVARFGDDVSAWVCGRGRRLKRLSIRGGMDGPDIAGHVLADVRELRRPGEIPRVKVDEIGIGASVLDVLSRSSEVVAIGVNESQRAVEATKYANARAEMHFAVRAWLKGGGTIDPDETKLHGDLVAAKFSFDGQGRLRVESKDDIKKRLKRSPDRGDALGLYVYEPATAPPPPSLSEFAPFANALPQSRRERRALR